MKVKIIISLVLILFIGASLHAQVKVDVKKKVTNQTNQRANNRTDQTIDKGLNKLEEGIGSLFGKKKKKRGKSKKNEDENQSQSDSNSEVSNSHILQDANQIDIKWAKFDFVPGDEVIFEDGPSIDEENGEFPSRWDLQEGNIEIATVNNENVIYYLAGGAIVPYMANSKEDYLPEMFTLECDMYFTPGESGRFWIKMYDAKNQRNVGKDIEVFVNGIECGGSEMRYPGTESYGWGFNKIGGWKHISIAFTKGKLKAYMDDTRLINIPHYEGNPTGISILAERFSSSKYKPLLRNIRIAKGGVKYYDRVLSDGKIIVNGIRFDVNKATIKHESNGAINKIFDLMQKQPELKFSVEGHTDSDGDEAFNQTLSESRAKAVIDRLISMGISVTRLKSTGWGESKPIGENITAEGKANNRRVEFVKFTGSVAEATTNSSNSIYDKLDKNTIGVKLEALPDAVNISVSNSSGITNGVGTIILYATSDGNLGKMKILDVDKNDNYKLTVKYVSYNYDGSVHSQSNHLEIPGTYTCDLDKGKIGDMIQSEVDFRLGRGNKTNINIYPRETAILRVLSN